MWNKSANFLMIRVKLQNHRGFTIPVSLQVVDELISAVQDIAWVGEVILKRIPLPQEERARQYIRYAKMIPLSHLLGSVFDMISDLRRHKGLDVVHVEVNDVQVKVDLR